MRSMRKQNTSETEILKNTFMPELTVPKCITPKFESFMDNLKSAVSRVDGIHGVPIDYLLRDVDGNYNDN